MEEREVHVRALLDSNCDMSVKAMDQCNAEIKQLLEDTLRDRFFTYMMCLHNSQTPQTKETPLQTFYEKSDVQEIVLHELLKDLEITFPNCIHVCTTKHSL